MRFRAKVAKGLCYMNKKLKNYVIVIGFILFVTTIFTCVILYNNLNEPGDVPVIDPPDIEMPVIEEDEAEAEDIHVEPVIMERFLNLYEQNSDLVGWVRFPGTDIDYPVVQCDNNVFYLNHSFEKKPLSVGTPFLDAGANILVNNNQSLSIYGHYVKIFTELHNYKDLEYYKNHPIFEFHTIYENGIYKIFSVFYMAGNSSDELFYYYPASNFRTDEQFMKHVKQLRTRSIFTTAVDIIPGDQLVLLTCCTYETDNLRLIIAGRRLRPGEWIAVNTESARLNPQPLYPRKWYDKKGGSPPQVMD